MVEFEGDRKTNIVLAPQSLAGIDLSAGDTAIFRDANPAGEENAPYKALTGRSARVRRARVVGAPPALAAGPHPFGGTRTGRALPLHRGRRRRSRPPAGVDCFTRGVRNVMRFPDMLEQEPEAAPPPLHLLGDANMDEVMSAPMAGYFRAQVELLDEVQAGQLVGTIHDPLGDLLAELRTEKDGIVIMRRGVHRVLSGDGLIHLTARAENQQIATALTPIPYPLPFPTSRARIHRAADPRRP